MKRLLSSVGIVLIFCGLATGQEVTTATGQGGPGRMFIEGPGPERMPLPRPGNVLYFRARTRMGGPMGEWWRNPELAQKVGLSDQQTQQLDKISYESQMKMIDLRATLEKERLTLGQMLQADHPNEDAVLGQVDKVSQARAAIERARVQRMLAIRNVLTVEQWKKLKAARMQFHRGFGMGMGRFGGRGMPMRWQAPPKP